MSLLNRLEMSRRKQLKPYHVLGEGETETTRSNNHSSDTPLTATTNTPSQGCCKGVRIWQGSPTCHPVCDMDITVNHDTFNLSQSYCSSTTRDTSDVSSAVTTLAENTNCRSVHDFSGKMNSQHIDTAMKGHATETGLCNGVVKQETDSVLSPRAWGTEPPMSPKSLALMRNICEYCGVVKKGPADLQRHLRKHTGERPFICQVCFKAFKAKRSLQYHEFAHHGVEPRDTKSCSRQAANNVILDKTQWPQKLSIASCYGNNRDRIVTLDEAVALFTLSEMDKPDGPSRGLNHKWLHLESGNRSLQECCKSDSNNNDSLLSSSGNATYKNFVDDGVASHKRPHDDTTNHSEASNARDTGDDLTKLALTAKRLRQTVVARRSSRIAAKQHTSPSNQHGQNGDMEKFYKCKVCAKLFSSAESLASHQHIAHNTQQMAPGDEKSQQPPTIVVDDKLCDSQSKKECSVSGCGEMQLLARDCPADGDTDGRGNNTQQHGSSSGSSSSGSQRDSDITQNTSPPTFGSTGCYDDGSLPPGGSGDDNVIEYPSVFPGLKHRLSIKNETVLVTRLDGIDTTSGCQISLFKCHMCGRMFRLLSRLQCHLSMHFDRQLLLFQCTLCDMQFQFKMQLLQHLRSHGVNNTDSPHLPGDATDSPHTATAPTSQGLLSVVSPTLSATSDVPLLSSEVTDMNTSDLQTNDQKASKKYLSHDVAAGGLYACRYCWKTFDRYFCLQRHERVHTGFKPCCCRHCGKGFSESRNLRQHMMRFHNDVSPAQLIKHVRRKMSGSGLSRINQRLAYVTPEMIACANVQSVVADTVGTSEAFYSQPFTAPAADVSGEWSGDPSCATPIASTPQPVVASHLASEIRKKESLGDDVTVVIPSDVPLDDVTMSQSRIDDRPMPWMMEDGSSTKESSSDIKPSVSSSDEIMSAPVKSILSYSQMKSSKRKLLPPTRGPTSPEVLPISGDTKTVDSWTVSCGQPQVGLPSPAATSSGLMDYVGRPMSAFSVSATAGSIPSVLPPRSDVLKPDSTPPPPLDSMSPSQFGLNFEDFDGDDDEMGGWLNKGHVRGTSLSRTHSRLNVVMSPLRRDEVCKPTLLPDGRTVYRCTYCNKDFTTLSDINRHMDFHEDIRPYKCRFCDYFARTNSQLKVHMMRHQGIREFHCRLCNYKGVTQSDLNRHTKSQIHVMKAQNECEQCGEGFVSAKNLQQHYGEKHPSVHPPLHHSLHPAAYSQGYNSL